MSKYLEFKQVPYEGKTKRFEIISKSQNVDLGIIKWNPHWRQYCFYPSSDTLWSRDCLKNIQDFLNNLMIERKLNNRSKPDYITTDDVEYELDKNE